MANTFKDVISQLQKQKSAIERAIAALQDVGDETVPGAESATSQRGRKTRRKRTLSADARRRIAEAQRQRWAAAKKAASKGAAKTAKKSA
ncbi:MAG: hypothetical protein JO270_14620 [Acidobacteriaceae bacterium]|nr:hypothetical protein [Acidobacteriaceae bacterium]MBV8570855.1 hypothetical protein [Acidobacteriaceae bacterium]